MANNKIQEGDVLDHLATADISSGDVVEMDSLVGIAASDILDTKVGAVIVEGVFELPKNAAQAFAQGEILYWDGSELTTTATANTLIGRASRADVSAATIGAVKLGRA